MGAQGMYEYLVVGYTTGLRTSSSSSTSLAELCQKSRTQKTPTSSNTPSLEQRLLIPDQAGQTPPENARSLHFLKVNIVVEEQHVLLV